MLHLLFQIYLPKTYLFSLLTFFCVVQWSFSCREALVAPFQLFQLNMFCQFVVDLRLPYGFLDIFNLDSSVCLRPLCDSLILLRVSKDIGALARWDILIFFLVAADRLVRPSPPSVKLRSTPVLSSRRPYHLINRRSKANAHSYVNSSSIMIM